MAGGENFEPSGAALDHGLLGMDEHDLIGESFGENVDELAGEGDFGNEENGGFLLVESIGGEGKVDIGFATTGYTAQKAGGARDGFELAKGGLLGGIEGNIRVRLG